MSFNLARVSNPELVLIEVSGKDAGTFLHNMLTQDIQSMQNHEAQFSLLCNDKGKVLAQFIIVKFEQHYFLVIHHSLAELLIQHLKRFIFRNQVIFAIQPNKITLYRAMESEKLPTQLLETVIINKQLLINIHDQPLELIGIHLSENPEKADTEINYSAWKKPLLEKGLLILTQALSDKYLPQTLHYLKWHMVSLKKGCYPGQEIINRIENLGEVKQDLFIASDSDTAINIGDELFDDNHQLCGEVVDVATDNISQNILAILEKNSPEKLKTKRSISITFKKLR